MADSEFRCSPHLLNKSSQPLVRSVEVHLLEQNPRYSLDEPTFILVVDQIQRVGCPGLFHLLDEFLQSHFTLSLRNDFFDQTLVSLQVQIVNLPK